MLVRGRRRATHHAALIDRTGRLLADAEFPASPTGYGPDVDLDASTRSAAVGGIEGTGACGAGLARHLHGQDVTVLEVPRPDRRLRCQRGKSDPIDAEAAACTVLAGNAGGAPILATGPIEAIRMLRVARTGAVKAKTAAANTLIAVVITAPEPLRSLILLGSRVSGLGSRVSGLGPRASAWASRVKRGARFGQTLGAISRFQKSKGNNPATVLATLVNEGRLPQLGERHLARVRRRERQRPGRNGQFPTTITLRIGDREFKAYIADIAGDPTSDLLGAQALALNYGRGGVG